jgi:predicted nucleic acid-binding protein
VSYVLDTCVLSEFTKPQPSASVDDWLARIPEREQFISALTLGELEKGIRKLGRGRRRTSFEEWFAVLRDRFADRTLVVDANVALEWGRIAADAELEGRRLPAVDSLIAATALVHRMTVVTRNTSDIARSGVRVFDPWK